MKKLFKCSVCGFVWEGEEAPDKCPKCSVNKEKFVQLESEDAEKIYRSDRTNSIHMEIITLADKIASLCKEGIEDALDPKCVAAFTQAKDEVWVIKQRAKAELAGHMNLRKW